VLTFLSPGQVSSEPEPIRFLHVMLLTCLRDRAERIEFRSTESGWLLYQRVEGRDWEMISPPEDVQLELKATIRTAARLVAPQRPDVSIVAGSPDAVFEPQQVGWLTYQLGQHLLDMVVRIDPREPWGSIRIELDHPEELAGLAGEALADYLGQLDDTDLE